MAHMTMFPSAPILRAVDRDRWMVERDYVDQRTGLLILRGFIFDGASIPRGLWRVCGHPMRGDILPAALLHDAEYAAQFGDRKTADEWFRSNLELLGMGPFRAWLFYVAVRVFGGISWKHNSGEVERSRRYIRQGEMPCRNSERSSRKRSGLSKKNKRERRQK